MNIIMKKIKNMKTYNEFSRLNETYYEDLTPYKYDQIRWAKNPVNIGWLEKGHDYETGEVPEGFLNRLKSAESCARHKGGQRCPFCGDGYSSEVHYVKGNGKDYVFPQMLSHYIRVHHYKPPQEFIDAVMLLPEV